MKPIYPIRFFVLLFSITLLVVSGCQEHPKEDINRGPPPTPKPVTGPSTNPLPPGILGSTPGWNVTGQLPQTLVCGQQYEVLARAKDNNLKTCTGYNYQKLYNRAVAIATKRVSNISCPQGCRPAHSWQIDRKWDCTNPLAPFAPHTAMAVVRNGVLCPNASQPRPTDAPFSILPPPYNTTYKGPAYYLLTGSGDIIDGDNSFVHAPAKCQSSHSIYIKYHEGVPDCQNLNYAPSITRAEEWAKLNYELQSCETPCTKHPFRVSGKGWNCTAPPSPASVGYEVDVDIIYPLECK